MTMNRQTLIEQRIYHLHQYIVQELRDNPQAVLKTARSNLKSYKKRNGDWKPYIEWEKKLKLPVDEIISILDSSDESAILARSNSPFAGCIPHRQRWKLLKEFNKQNETS